LLLVVVVVVSTTFCCFEKKIGRLPIRKRENSASARSGSASFPMKKIQSDTGFVFLFSSSTSFTIALSFCFLKVFFFVFDIVAIKQYDAVVNNEYTMMNNKIRAPNKKKWGNKAIDSDKKEKSN
jgi:hypothetical protein